MSDAPGWLFGLFAVLLLLSAAFSSSETALFSLNESQRARAGAAAQKLLSRPRHLLVVVLVGNLVVNLFYFALVPRLHPERGSALPVDVGALVALLLAGEIFPKLLGLRARVPVARALAPLIYALFVILGPVRVLLTRMLDAVGRMISRVLRDDAGLTPDDLAHVLESGAEDGSLDVAEADLLAEIVELADIRVREIMTPRVDATFLDLSGAGRGEAARRAVERKLSWLPVVDATPDQVVGRVSVRDLLNRPDRSVAELVMPVKFVPEVASALDLLRALQDDRVAEAVVLDEWGGTAGIVTIEHVFEELVGDLRSEGELRAHAAVPLGEGRFRVPGNLMIRDWNERFGFQVVPTEFETVGGFVTALLGRIPRTGDVARYGDLVLEVHEARGRRVLSVDLAVAAAADDGPAGSTEPAQEARRWRA
jgi:putative hemolysin